MKDRNFTYSIGQVVKLTGLTQRALRHDEGKETPVSQMFEGFDPAIHEEETEKRWGATASFAQAQRRTKSYSKADWTAIKAQWAEIYGGLFALKEQGLSTGSQPVQALVEQHRQLLHTRFYDCDQAMHANLAALYEADARFAKNIDKHGEGLTPFLVEAIRASC